MTKHGANFQKVERTGRNNNIITPAGSSNGRNVAELSSHEDIQARDLDPETDLVAELSEDGSATIREIQAEDNVVSVSVDRLNDSRLNRFFTEEELSSLRDKEETIEGEEKPDIDQVWSDIEEGVRKHNKEVAKNKKELEKKRLKEAYRDPALDKKMKNMTGEQMQRVMSDDNSSTVDESELQEALNQVEDKYSGILNESEPDIEDPSTQIDELDKGLEAWKDSEKEYWHDFVEDLEESDEETMYESVGPNSKRVTTQSEEMKVALRNHENEPFDGTVELEEDTGETVIAVVKEE